MTMPDNTGKLIDAALSHLALERAAACVLQVPDTDPPLFVAVGPAPAIAKLLQDEMPASLELPDLDRLRKLADDLDVNFQYSSANTLREVIASMSRAQPEGEVRHQRKRAALQELVDIAQENDMGYGAPVGLVCWSCKRGLAIAQRADTDGNCPHCHAEIEHDHSEGGHHD